MKNDNVFKFIYYKDIMTSPKLLDWINKDMLILDYVLDNPNPKSFKFIKDEYMDYIVNNSLSIEEFKKYEDLYSEDEIYYDDCNEYSLFWKKISEFETDETIIRNNLQYILWKDLNKNPNAISILKEHIDKIDWKYLSENPMAIDILKENPDKINHKHLLNNPNNDIIDILDINKCKKIDTPTLINFLNNHINSYSFIEQNIDRIIEKASIEYFFWFRCRNTKIIELLMKKCESKINWDELSRNPAAISILLENLDKVNWSNLCENYEAYDIIMANPTKIDWNTIFNNNNIKFKEFLIENRRKIKEYIVVNMLCNEHPSWKMDLITKKQFLKGVKEACYVRDSKLDYFENATLRELEILKEKYFVKNPNDISLLSLNPNIFR